MCILRQPRAPKLGQSKIAITSIPPKETVSYSKETQTPVEQVEQDSEGMHGNINLVCYF